MTEVIRTEVSQRQSRMFETQHDITNMALFTCDIQYIHSEK